MLLRNVTAYRLLSAAFVFTICFYVFRLYNPVWTIRDVLPFPYSSTTPEPPSTIPEKLWYKLGPKGLNDELRGYIDTFITKNPTFETEFLTDESGDEFVRSHFASRPEMVETFLAINIPIIKADLLRYLVLYEYGGIWNDLDVSCDVPITEWVPEQYKANASIIVGLEFDVDAWIRQFATWTILAKKGSLHLMTAVEDCLDYLSRTAEEKSVGIQDLRVDMIGDIVDVSGPRRMTGAILKSLSNMLNETVGNANITHTLEPKLIGDVLVLPDYAFAESMNQLYGDKIPGQVLATHHYAGSWKNSKGGEDLF